MAERIDDRVERREAPDWSDVYVFSDRAETFLLGGRTKPPGRDDEYDVAGRLLRTFLLRDRKRDGLASVVPARDAGRFGVMKP